MKRLPSLIAYMVLPALLLSGAPALSQSIETGTDNSVAAEKPTAIAPGIPPSVEKAIARDPDAYLRKVDRIFERQATDGVLTRAFLADGLLLKRARLRASKLVQFLSWDVDGDGDITAAERALLLSHGPGGDRYQRFFEQVVKEADADSDGVLSYGELVTYADREMDELVERAADRDPDDFRNFDRNGDGNVHKDEVVAVVEEIRARKPAVTDGETASRPSRESPAARPASRSSCTAPMPGKDAETVILSGYGGAALSTATVAGLERETSVATINVEEGERPLYVLANAYEPIVWKVEGAVDRIARFVVQSGHPGHSENDAGVVGLDKKVVAFVPKKSCVPNFTSSTQGGATLAQARMATRFGRPVDHVIARPALAGIHLPSGKQDPNMKIERQGMIVETAGRTFELTSAGCRLLYGSQLENRVKSHYPGGVVKIAPTDVVAAGPVAMYDVLPGPAGILQLMHLGAISRTRDGYFLIHREIPRFPAGFGGGKFILADGVPVPAGAARQRSVVRQSTGECVPGARCERN